MIAAKIYNDVSQKVECSHGLEYIATEKNALFEHVGM